MLEKSSSFTWRNGWASVKQYIAPHFVWWDMGHTKKKNASLKWATWSFHNWRCDESSWKVLVLSFLVNWILFTYLASHFTHDQLISNIHKKTPLYQIRHKWHETKFLIWCPKFSRKSVTILAQFLPIFVHCAQLLLSSMTFFLLFLYIWSSDNCYQTMIIKLDQCHRQKEPWRWRISFSCLSSILPKNQPSTLQCPSFPK